MLDVSFLDTSLLFINLNLQERQRKYLNFYMKPGTLEKK